MKKWVLTGQVLVLSLLLLVAFQNCGQVAFEARSELDPASQADPNEESETAPPIDSYLPPPIAGREMEIITGVAYCAEYQNGRQNTWGWGCGGGQGEVSSWTFIGQAQSGGCPNGHIMTNQVYSIYGRIVGFSCVQRGRFDLLPPDQILGAGYCAPDHQGDGGCGDSNSSNSTWKFIGTAGAGVSCLSGSISYPVLSYGGVVGFACISGNIPVIRGAQPQNLEKIIGAGYCAETQGQSPNWSCGRFTLVGSAQTGSQCADGTLADRRLSVVNGSLVGFTCKKSFFTLPESDYFAGVGYCAEAVNGGCGTVANGTWTLVGAAQSGGCHAGTNLQNALKSRDQRGNVGFTCLRN